MSRELRFRVWDESKGKYTNIQQLANDIFWYSKDNTTLHIMPIYKKHIIEQYTGQKDKNGNKIYEGDI